MTPATRDAVVRMLSFQPGDVTQPEDVGRVIGDDHPDTLVYLALPPSLLTKVLPALATTTLGAADAVAIEKPFGTDLASAHELNEILRIQLPEPTIFRIDHFLSSELVRRVVTLRFLNRVFEPILNAVHVERVDISWLESLTLEGRASYYDGAGAMKDMVQNHLMEAMALVLMEQPARIDADSFRVGARRGAAGGRHAVGGADAQRHDPRPLHRGHDRLPAGALLRRRARRRPQPQHRDLRLPDPRPEQPPLGRRPVHPALGQGARDGLRRDRHPLPPAAPVPDRPVARRRAQRAPDRSHGTVRAPGHHAQRPGAHRRDPRARGARHPAAVHGLRPPDPGDAPRRPDAVHPRRRGRGGLAHHRPRDGGVVGRQTSRCRSTPPAQRPPAPRDRPRRSGPGHGPADRAPRRRRERRRHRGRRVRPRPATRRARRPRRRGARRARTRRTGPGARAVAQPGARRPLPLRRPRAPAAADRAGARQRDPRPRALRAVGDRRGGARPRPPATVRAAATRLPVRARGRGRARPRRDTG